MTPLLHKRSHSDLRHVPSPSYGQSRTSVVFPARQSDTRLMALGLEPHRRASATAIVAVVREGWLRASDLGLQNGGQMDVQLAARYRAENG